MRIFLLAWLTAATLFAYSDLDLDGVEDAVDQCPNTPMMDLVDIRGCSIESLVSPHHYDIIVGANYSQVDYSTNEKTDTLTTTLQVDYFYKNISLQASTSYYSSQSGSYSESGMGDSTLAGFYLLPLSRDFRIRLGAGANLPTYEGSLNNNNTDYLALLSASYAIEKVSLFAGYNFTQINDDDIAGVASYQDTHAYSGGVGYSLTPKLYSSLSYYQSDSLYKGVEPIKSASLYGFYSLDTHWFSTFSYAYGLSDSASDHSVSFRLGYYL